MFNLSPRFLSDLWFCDIVRNALSIAEETSFYSLFLKSMSKYKLPVLVISYIHQDIFLCSFDSIFQIIKYLKTSILGIKQL